MPDSALGWLKGYVWRDLDESTVLYGEDGAYIIRKADGSELHIKDLDELYAFLHAINPDVPAQPQRMPVTDGDHL